ncbi:SpoIID/LytB domain-containing protein [Rubrivirga sp.]|uniref:SpoIID/LytB domain-containing protein n=1 Tax=Rubrivirga sp. TaxID=1885344 RepID=UPI003B521FAC
MRLLRYALLATVLAAPALAQPAPDVVRVRVLSSQAPTEVRVEPLAGPLRVFVDGIEGSPLVPGETATLSGRGRDVRVRVGGADLSGRTVRLAGDGVRLRAGSTTREYPGDFVVGRAGDRLELVTHAPVEPYVASVVQSEFGFPVLEGAKAQAVLARTYAARRAGAHPTYDLDDDQRSQVYRGSGPATDLSRRAAAETRGEVLTYGGTLAEAAYFSSSGGHTADNDAVWAGAPVPYLRGVPDPFDADAPDHRWRTSADRAAVLGALSRRYGGTVRDVTVERRSRSGRVVTVRLVGGRTETISGSAFRQAVNGAVGARTVRSTRFEITTDGGRYVFEGSGFGHGVGMSQYGALGQARAGRGYREILAYYFAGTEVRPGTTGGVRPALIAMTPPAPGTAPAAVPRQPDSSLGTRYVPPTARRWPTPRRVVRDRANDDTSADVAKAPVPPAQRPPMTPPPAAPTPRRTGW